MFSIRKERTPSPLDDLIEDAYAALKGMDESTEAYETALKNLKSLLETDIELKSHRGPSPEAILSAVTTLGGIAMVLLFEQKHVITTKSLSMLPRNR